MMAIQAQRAFFMVGQALGLGLADLIAALDPELI
jgi:predicted NBD/HSP70 family sugar kinase